MSKYKCIIFDCDGVLVDSETIGGGVLVDMANSLGANLKFENTNKLFKGKSLEDCMGIISKEVSKPLPSSFELEYREKSFKAFKEGIQPINGIAEVLKKLKVPFCVASSGPESKIRLNLELTGLLPFFDSNIFSCYTIQKWKPEPDVFLWASETMGFKPNECLVIEDSISGVRAANAGGFDVFGYAEHDYNNELRFEATKTFNHMEELLGFL
ncbi:HAD family hydrolase [Algibacter sp.]|uniref:HAD family hydrolase n=1 Tax=Algibacter sp. TaxID=1872428 RepID=UPI003C734884